MIHEAQAGGPTLLLSLGLLVAAAAGRLLPGGEAADFPGWTVGQGLLAVSGLGILWLVPGLSFLPLWRRVGWLAPEALPFSSLGAAALGSVGWHALGQTLLTLSGQEATFWPMWGHALVGVLLGAGFGRLRHIRGICANNASAIRFGNDESGGTTAELESSSLMGSRLLARGVGLGVLVAAFAVATTPPRFVDLDRYWSEEIYSQAAALDFSEAAVTPPGLTLSVETGFEPLGERRYRLARDRLPSSATLRLDCRRSEGCRAALRLVLHNGGPQSLGMDLRLDGQRLPARSLKSPAEGDFTRPEEEGRPIPRLPALYRAQREPRNSPPPLRLLQPDLRLPQGTHRLELTFTAWAPEDQGAGPPRVELLDLSFLSAHALGRALHSHAFVGDTGDIYETLDFARGFRRYALQHSSSYDGDRHDGGGPTSISDEPPGHHLLGFLALTFIRDSVTSLSLLYLSELVLMALLAVHLVSRGTNGLSYWHYLFLFLILCGYTRICRLGLESNAPDTLFLLCWLGVLWLFQGGRWAAAAGLAALSLYIHIPAPQSAVLLGAAAFIAGRRREAVRFTGLALLLMAALVAGRFVVLCGVVGPTLAWFSGQAAFLGENRAGLMQTALLDGRPEVLLQLVGEAKAWVFLVLVASGAALPLLVGSSLVPRRFRPERRDDDGQVLVLFGFFYALAMTLLDRHRAHHAGPAALPLALALARRLPRLRGAILRHVGLGLALLAALLALAFLLVAGADPTDTLNTIHLRAYTFIPED